MAASVDAETVRLQFLRRSIAVPLGEMDSVGVESVTVAGSLLWSGIRIRHEAGSAQVSDLPQTIAGTLADAAETARIDRPPLSAGGR